MKAILVIGLLAVATTVWAGRAPTPPRDVPAVVKGVVLETMDSGGYTYLRLKTADAETWAAVNRANVSKGAKVTLLNVMVMTDFESKSLKKTFPTILFATLDTAGAVKVVPGKSTETPDIKVAKASGANARTVEEVVNHGAALKDKPVLVRGKVVKYNPGIMGKNWLHLRDGSGSSAANSNDILVTTLDTADKGETVTVQGVVRTDKDFGAGYVYKVLIEDAKLQR